MPSRDEQELLDAIRCHQRDPSLDGDVGAVLQDLEQLQHRPPEPIAEDLARQLPFGAGGDPSPRAARVADAGGWRPHLPAWWRFRER